MKVAIYARVSTKKQELEMQLREVQQYSQLKGWTVYEIYEEKMSGKIPHPPELARLLRAAVRGSFGVVLVWKFDRVARGARQLLEIMEQLRHLGIAFVSIPRRIRYEHAFWEGGYNEYCGNGGTRS